jgi:DGQHR domain-containing protein
MSNKELEQRFGTRVLDLGVCSLGQNLNLVSIRGFANLGELAAVSGADTYNKFRNPEGTQRHLSNSHSVDAVKYAIASQSVAADEDARAFPEIILSVRNLDVIEFYNPVTNAPINADQLNSNAHPGLGMVGVRVALDKLTYPVEVFEPEISRVDGNHRLSAANLMVEAEPDEIISFPSVPFALHIGLSKEQERKIFRDINGFHKGMETALLDNFTLSLAGESARLDEAMRPLWVAAQLSEPGFAFEDMVSMGGSVQEYKDQFGTNPPLKINTLKAAVKLTLSTSSQLTITYKDKPEIVLSLINKFWLAVREIMPEAWTDKKNFILLETVGLMAFSKWAGSLIELAVEKGQSGVDFFKPYILAVKSTVPLAKAENAGLAGAAGQKVVYEKLILAVSNGNVGQYQVLLDLDTKNSIDDAFGE